MPFDRIHGKIWEIWLYEKSIGHKNLHLAAMIKFGRVLSVKNFGAQDILSHICHLQDNSHWNMDLLCYSSLNLVGGRRFKHGTSLILGQNIEYRILIFQGVSRIGLICMFWVKIKNAIGEKVSKTVDIWLKFGSVQKMQIWPKSGRDAWSVSGNPVLRPRVHKFL